MACRYTLAKLLTSTWSWRADDDAHALARNGTADGDLVVDRSTATGGGRLVRPHLGRAHRHAGRRAPRLRRVRADRGLSLPDDPRADAVPQIGRGRRRREHDLPVERVRD